MQTNAHTLYFNRSMFLVINEIISRFREKSLASGFQKFLRKFG